MGSGRWALWILFKIKIIYYISKLNKCIIFIILLPCTYTAQKDHPTSQPSRSACPTQQESESPKTTAQRVNINSKQGKLNNVDKINQKS